MLYYPLKVGAEMLDQVAEYFPDEVIRNWPMTTSGNLIVTLFLSLLTHHDQSQNYSVLASMSRNIKIRRRKNIDNNFLFVSSSSSDVDELTVLCCKPTRVRVVQ
jgi:hypothetical protein